MKLLKRVELTNRLLTGSFTHHRSSVGRVLVDIIPLLLLGAREVVECRYHQALSHRSPVAPTGATPASGRCCFHWCRSVLLRQAPPCSLFLRRCHPGGPSQRLGLRERRANGNIRNLHSPSALRRRRRPKSAMPAIDESPTAGPAPIYHWLIACGMNCSTKRKYEMPFDK